jgi:hypothetical protein
MTTTFASISLGYLFLSHRVGLSESAEDLLRRINEVRARDLPFDSPEQIFTITATLKEQCVHLSAEIAAILERSGPPECVSQFARLHAELVHSIDQIQIKFSSKMGEQLAQLLDDPSMEAIQRIAYQHPLGLSISAPEVYDLLVGARDSSGRTIQTDTSISPQQYAQALLDLQEAHGFPILTCSNIGPIESAARAPATILDEFAMFSRSDLWPCRSRIFVQPASPGQTLPLASLLLSKLSRFPECISLKFLGPRTAHRSDAIVIYLGGPAFSSQQPVLDHLIGLQAQHPSLFSTQQMFYKKQEAPGIGTVGTLGTDSSYHLALSHAIAAAFGILRDQDPAKAEEVLSSPPRLRDWIVGAFLQQI